ncbi:MAG: Trk system potassium transporter TrkA [Lachnospiraceae bacterium]|nr:Trk system potassium transporter TrkA [Lachnospiraceae bacterium]
MKIIVIGCGKIGYAVAKSLAKENHDVAVIDENPKRIEYVTNTLDVMGVVGNGASHRVLADAGVESADLVVALTHSDERNILCSMIAMKAGGARAIAKVTDPVYSEEVPYIMEDTGIAMLLNPEKVTADHIIRLLKMPSAISIETFTKGQAEILKLEVPEDCDYLNMSLVEIMKRVKEQVLICAVSRDGDVFIPGGDYKLQAGDLIEVLGAPKASSAFVKKLKVPGFTKVRMAMLMGASGMSEYIATELIKHGINVKVFDKDESKCIRFSQNVPDAVVINSDPTAVTDLNEEGIENADAYVAISPEDEQNVLLSLYASSKSDAKVVTLLNHENYETVTEHLNIGSTMSLQRVSAGMIVRYVRALNNSKGSNMESFVKMMDDKAFAMEFMVSESSPVIGIPLADLRLKRGALFACIVRGRKTIIPSGVSVIEGGDTVIVVTTREDVMDISDLVEE